MESNQSSTYNPHSGKGRKRTSTEPVSTRQAQNRENQRKLREKKAAYISDLERRIAELEASSQIPVLQTRINSLEAEVTLLRSRQNQLDQHTNMPIATSSTSTSVCLQCSTERLKTSICMDQIRVLEDQLRAANASSSILTTSASPASTIRFPTSYELFGPMEIDSTILALKQLPSLHGSSIVNDFCTLLTEHTQISDSKTARRHLLRMARTCTDLFDTCTLIDRMKAVEVFSLFQQRNSSHVKYFDQFILSTEPRYRHPKPAGFMDPPRTKSLKDAMHEIPSLFLHRDTIDEFCELAMDGYSAILDPRGENFFIMRELQAKLEDACSVEDRTRFWVLAESAREGKRKEMRELIDRAERANS